MHSHKPHATSQPSRFSHMCTRPDSGQTRHTTAYTNSALVQKVNAEISMYRWSGLVISCRRGTRYVYDAGFSVPLLMS